MVRKYFGTDGIRGKANEGAMTAETALRVGMAAGRVFRRGDHRHRVVIGKDTRLSGYMLEPALTAGFTSMGMDVFLFGPLPTTYRKNKRTANRRIGRINALFTQVQTYRKNKRPFHPSPTALDRS
uniref:Phosphoglucosamine mutase n=1 Tax=Vibrio vulnificus TaxID=672 RepID=A0A1W6ARD8_VIBVL|nr:phosphoglucosamine mutase [Vibrio vulnificus]